MHQVPEIAVEILEHGDRPVALFRWLAHENDTPAFVDVEIAPEVVRVEKQEHATSRLVSYTRQLLGSHGTRKEQLCLDRAGRSDQDPALLLSLDVGIFDEVESEESRIGA